MPGYKDKEGAHRPLIAANHVLEVQVRRHFTWYYDDVVNEKRYQRFTSPPKGSFFLFGVREVGKSTWARSQFPDAYVVDLLDESRYQTLLASPGLLGLELRDLPSHQAVVLDEVQRVPPLLNEVHRAIEASHRRFILLGSSARRLKTASTNLLAGRAVVHTMYPLVSAELERDFDLDRVMRFGSIPRSGRPTIHRQRWKLMSSSM